MKRIPRLRIAFLMLLLSVAGAADQAVRLTESSFGFRASVEGDQFEASFSDFSVVPQLGPERLPTGFAVKINMADIDSGSPDRDAEMQLTEWFDTAAHPVATFLAQEVEIAPRGGYVARGQLLIKGVGRSISVPFSWQSSPRELRMTGEVMLDRRWFGVGPRDDSSVAGQVTVFFKLAWGSDEY